MNSLADRRCSPRQAVEVSTALVVALWRVLYALPYAMPLAVDPLLVLALWFGTTALTPRSSRTWVGLTAVTAVWLLAIHIVGLAPAQTRTLLHGPSTR